MKGEGISRDWTDILREVILSIIALIILFLGWILDFLGIVLIEIDSERVFSLCTVIISAQIAFIGIAYSLITINSSFQNTQKFGICIIDYMVRKKYLFLNQRNILFIEVIMLVASICCMIFEFFYSTCSLFICSLLFICNLSIDVFTLYRNDVIEEKMFNFLKRNLHNKKLNLLENYSEAERSWLLSKENHGRKPQSRLKELWINELKFINNDYFKEVHNDFVSLINDYISSSNDYIQDYGLDVAKNIVEEIYKLKQPKPQVNARGEILDNPTEYVAGLFYNIMPRVSELFYLRQNTSKIYALIYLMSHFDEGKSKYSQNTSINSFFHIIVEEPESTLVNERLESLFEYFSVCWFEDNPNVMQLCTTNLIHLSVKAIRAGKIRVVEHEMLSNNYMMTDNNHYQMLFATVICYMYYIAYCEEDDIIALASRGFLSSQAVRDSLDRNCSIILDVFSSITLDKDFRDEIHNWLSHYELISSSKRESKLSIIDYSIDKFLILYKTLASPIDIASWLPKLVADDWYRYYDIISSEAFSDDFMEIGNRGNCYDDKFIKSIIADLRDNLSKIAVDVEMQKSILIDEHELEDYLNQGIASFKEAASFGKIKAYSEKRHIQFIKLYKKHRLYKHTSDMYLYSIINGCYQKILSFLYSKVDKVEIQNNNDIEYYLNKVKEFDIHYGAFPIHVCTDNPDLAEKLHEVFKRGRANYLKDNTINICFDADSKSFGFNVDNMIIHIRKLNDEDRSYFYPTMVEDKHKIDIVNNMEVLLDDDKFKSYVDCSDRVIQVDFDVTVSIKPEAGFCSRFYLPQTQ